MTTCPILPSALVEQGVFVGRVWRPAVGPSLVTIRSAGVFDISTPAAPTMRDLLELPDPVDYVGRTLGLWIASLETLAASSLQAAGEFDSVKAAEQLHVLAPCDLQAIKACGVTFAGSMIERVIEERAKGDPGLAHSIRERIAGVLSSNLSQLQPGSEAAHKVKDVLQAEGLWSQYLEVGIGPDAEVFSKAQPLSAVGWGAEIGILAQSRWNNPEPEVVLACNSQGKVMGASLGNDVNLRDIEGRSALLLGKAKDNNASASIGPFIRLCDRHFGMAQIATLRVDLRVQGTDGFVLQDHSTMRAISRSPQSLVEQTCGAHHQYPDGFMLYCGTLFAPTQDRDAAGHGFTHHLGDQVLVSCAQLGALLNTVRHAHAIRPWTFGAAALMRNLAQRGLI